jgi:hypothetical protein
MVRHQQQAFIAYLNLAKNIPHVHRAVLQNGSLRKKNVRLDIFLPKKL